MHIAISLGVVGIILQSHLLCCSSTCGLAEELESGKEPKKKDITSACGSVSRLAQSLDLADTTVSTQGGQTYYYSKLLYASMLLTNNYVYHPAGPVIGLF